MPCYPKGTGHALAFIRANVGYQGNDCLIWPFSKNWNGYGQVNSVDGGSKYAHRFMCELAHGKPPTKNHVAAHSCNNGGGGCVNPKHISWKTPRENLLDRRAAGTSVPSRRWNNKGMLTDEQIAEICALKGTLNQREIAVKFGISYQHVSVVQNGKLKRTLRKDDQSVDITGVSES